MKSARSRLGELLVQHQWLTSLQLQQLLNKQEREGGKFISLLLQMDLPNKNEILQFLAQQLHVKFVDLKHVAVNPEVVHLLPEAMARRFQALPLESTSNGLLMGMVDPQDVIAIDELSKELKCPLQLALIREEDWLETMDTVYRRTEDISAYARELSAEVVIDKQFDVTELGNLQDAHEAPVTKFLQSLFIDAVQARASDIHLEPDENVLRIRQRIDGVLQENLVPEKSIASAVALRLKLMSGLKIAEKRLPQDGRFSIRIHGKTIDVRLSTLPGQYGESIVMRLLDRHSTHMHLNQLGISTDVLKVINKLLTLPHGMILITGPTGSGKTSTLYSMLSELNRAESKIITVEDPVEYRLPRITQVQVNPSIGLTFSSVLRAALRQDPDILMVGEIRDRETANIALNAAMTGHFVLATMHTNDAISSATRLLDMQNESYVVAAGLRAVMAQRLLRKVCEACHKTYTPTRQEKLWLQKYLGEQISIEKLKKGEGCSHCYHTGYRGRIPTFELFEVDEEVAEALTQKDIGEFMKVVRKKGYVSLLQNALSLALKGITTVQEALRVTIGTQDVSTTISEDDSSLTPVEND